MSSRVTLFVLCCIFAACTAASANIVPNGDFESGVLAPWVSSYDPTVTYSVIVDPSNASNHILQGVPGPQHDDYPSNWWLCNVSNAVAMSGGTKYDISVDIKTVGDWEWGTKDYGLVQVYEFNASNGVTAIDQFFGQASAHDWAANAGTFTSNAATTHASVMYNGALISGAQAVYFDNFNVTAAVPEPGSLVALLSGLGMFGGLIRRRK